MLKLIQHFVVNENGNVPEIPDCLYAYMLAGNGVFLYAKRIGLEVLIPATVTKIAGLPSLQPYVNISRRIPACLLVHVLKLSLDHLPNEMLFWFNSKEYWTLQIPQQLTTPTSVAPAENLDEMGTSALVDLHSHGALPPFFSRADNHDEQGFRIYAVLGQVDKTPSLRVRVGVYGNYFDIPASTVFESVDGILDAFVEERRQDDYEIE